MSKPLCVDFMFVLISQSSRRVVEMMTFLSSQRNIRDVVKSARIFNTIEIMCLRLLRHRVMEDLVAELVEATVCGFFVLVFITQSSRRVVEMMTFFSSQRNIRDVL